MSQLRHVRLDSGLRKRAISSTRQCRASGGAPSRRPEGSGCQADREACQSCHPLQRPDRPRPAVRGGPWRSGALARQRYVDDRDVAAPSVIAINAMGTAWAANDLMQFLSGLGGPALRLPPPRSTRRPRMSRCRTARQARVPRVRRGCQWRSLGRRWPRAPNARERPPTPAPGSDSRRQDDRPQPCDHPQCAVQRRARTISLSR
jgi:hypothetical protein